MTWAEQNAVWRSSAHRRWSPRSPEPLHVRCWLSSPVAYDGYDPLTIEGALQCAVVLRETGRTPDDVFSACPVRAPLSDTDIAIPIVDDRFGNVPIAMASVGWFSGDARATKRQSWKRADAEYYSKRVVKVAEAANKTQMLLKATVTALYVDFYVCGDRALLTDLLTDVSHLGASRAGGLGELHGVEVHPCNAKAWFVGPGTRLMRVLPHGRHTAHRGSFDTRESTLRAPYWHHRTRELCDVPVQRLGVMC